VKGKIMKRYRTTRDTKKKKEEGKEMGTTLLTERRRHL